MPSSQSRPRRPRTAVTLVKVEPEPTTTHRTVLGLPNPLPRIEALLKRDEADIIIIAGNVALIAFDVVEWPIVVMTQALHLMSRSRFKSLEAVAKVAEEVE